MNWLKALLEKAVITDGVLDVDALMTSVNAEFPKHAVPKDTYNTLADTKKQLDLDISQRDKQLKDLGDTAGLSQKLKDQIDTLQNDNKEAKKKHEAEMKEVRLNSAIKLAIQGKVHDEDLAVGLINKEELVVSDEGKVVGLDEQLTGLKESKAFLFVDEKPAPEIKGAKPADGDSGGNGGTAISSEAFNKMGYKEMLKLKKENPDQYKILSGQ